MSVEWMLACLCIGGHRHAVAMPTREGIVQDQRIRPGRCRIFTRRLLTNPAPGCVQDICSVLGLSTTRHTAASRKFSGMVGLSAGLADQRESGGVADARRPASFNRAPAGRSGLVWIHGLSRESAAAEPAVCPDQ